MSRIARSLHGALLTCALPLVIACAGSGPAPPASTVTLPSILTQPQNLSLPMGVAGTFSVLASGDNLQYQWSRSGTPIAGAVARTYTTPVAAFADSGTPYSVVVHNSLATLTSVPAILTVTARAPISGDLRFQQVDAPSTINGYGVGNASYGSELFCVIPGEGGLGLGFTSEFGSALFLSNKSCPLQFIPLALPAGVSGLDSGDGAFPLSQYPDLLTAGYFYDTPLAPGDPGSVITSLNLLPSFETVSFSFLHSETVSGFDRAQYTVAATAFQAAATSEGQRGRVVTAVSYDGAMATYLSYGWTGDPNSVYETKVVYATLDTAAMLFAQLAGEGYLLTASGTTHAPDGSGVVLVGTRLRGDTMPRPYLVDTDYSKVMGQGYAIVAGLQTYLPAGTIASTYFIGER